MAHTPVSHIPQKLHDDIQATLKTDDYSLYASDGQGADDVPGAENWHDAIAVTETLGGTITAWRFTLKPDETLFHYRITEEA